MNNAPDTTKISISVYPDLLKRFKSRLGQTLKRDAFLNLLIAQELPMVRGELGGLRNSEAARRHIAREFRNMGAETINVVIDKELAEQLNQVVEEFNMVRDSFLNYLLYCLDPTPGFFTFFELPEYYTYSEFETETEPPALSAMHRISAALEDPFHYLRAAVRDKWSYGLYALEMPPMMHGLACYLPDESVPTTRAFKSQQDVGEFLFKELEALDSKAFGNDGEGAAK